MRLSKNNEKSWKEIMFLSQRMMDSAKVESWSEVASLEKRRKVLIHNLFSSLQEDEKTEELKQGIVQLIGLNESLLKQAKQHRGSVQSELTTIQRGKAANAAYKKVSRDLL